MLFWCFALWSHDINRRGQTFCMQTSSRLSFVKHWSMVCINVHGILSLEKVWQSQVFPKGSSSNHIRSSQCDFGWKRTGHQVSPMIHGAGWGTCVTSFWSLRVFGENRHRCHRIATCNIMVRMEFARSLLDGAISSISTWGLEPLDTGQWPTVPQDATRCHKCIINDLSISFY